MRYRQPFTLVKRTLKSGRHIYYYRTYDESGNRTSAFSTGQEKKGRAEQVCWTLFKAGKLIPTTSEAPSTFGQFAAGFWDWDGEYVVRKRNRGTISNGYVDAAARLLSKHILPRFGVKQLESITPLAIERWMQAMANDGAKPASINRRFANLKTILGEAVRQQLISTNPAKAVELYREPETRRAVLNPEEVRMLFAPENFERLWNGNAFLYSAGHLGCVTGARLGEVQAIRGIDIHADEGYVHFEHSWDRKYGLKELKNRDLRDSVIPSFTCSLLRRMRAVNGDGFIHSYDGGESPINHRQITNAHVSALSGIGISTKEVQDRKCTFHSWRSGFITKMSGAKIADSKIRANVGHKTAAMTERYRQFNRGDMKDVTDVLESWTPNGVFQWSGSDRGR